MKYKKGDCIVYNNPPVWTENVHYLTNTSYLLMTIVEIAGNVYLLQAITSIHECPVEFVSTDTYIFWGMADLDNDSNAALYDSVEGVFMRL